MTTAKKTPTPKAKTTQAAPKTKASESKATYPESVRNSARILFELRAQRLELIDLRGISETADFMLVSTCESEAQMQAILDELSKEFKANKLPHRTEYKPGINMRWAVFDAGFDLMVQLFEEEKREELAFDKLYADAPISLLEEKDFIQAKQKKAKAEDELV